MATSIPGPVRRLLRDRLRVLSVVLLALAILLIAGLQSQAVATLRKTLDEGWRGAYDLLVTAPGGTTTTKAAAASLLPPGTLGSDPEQGLSLDDVTRIRAIAGVDVAAPITQIAVQTSMDGGLYFAFPLIPGKTTSAPKAYRVTATYWTDDGLGKRLVSSQILGVVLDDADVPQETPIDPSQLLAGDTCTTGADSITYPMTDPHCSDWWFTPHEYAEVTNGKAWVPDNGRVSGDYALVSLDGETSEDVVTTMTLVDPAEEAKLLGKSGRFLDPLVKADAASASPEAMPVVAASRTQAELHASYEVESFGPVTETTDPMSPYALPEYTLPDGLLNGTKSGTPVGSTDVDLAPLRTPLAPKKTILLWPGATPRGTLPDPSELGWWGTNTVVDPDPGTVLGAPHVTVDGHDRATLSPSIFADTSTENQPVTMRPSLIHLVPTTPEGTQIGAESAYTALGLNSLGPLPSDAQDLDLTKVGTFSPSDVTSLTKAWSYVPLGGYDPTGATLVADPSGKAITPVTLKPSLSGLGLVNQASTMIGSYQGAAVLLRKAPVSAVRVRVAGITGYSDTSLAKIVRVKNAIEALGFQATVVAGASPTAEKVLVKDYAFGTRDASVPQKVGTLGVVEQQWTELGAASRVSTAVSHGSTLALVVGLAAVGLLTGAATFVGIPRRRRTAAVLAMTGWRRRRTMRWFAAEDALAGVVVAAAATAAWALAEDRHLVLLGAAIALAAFVVLAVVSVVAGTKPVRARTVRANAKASRGHRLRTRLRGLTVTSFGLRQALLHPAPGIAAFLTILIVGAAAASLGVLVVEERADAGASRISDVVGDRVFLTRIGFTVVAVVAGLLLAAMTRRLAVAARATQFEVLRTAGWTAKERRQAQRVEAVAVAVPALLVTAGLCWWIDRFFLPAGTSAWWPIAVGVVAALLTGLATLVTSRKDHP